jgi:hypothetical protein
MLSEGQQFLVGAWDSCRCVCRMPQGKSLAAFAQLTLTVPEALLFENYCGRTR